MSEEDRVAEDPRFQEFPIPGTAEQVIQRIVDWVQISVGDEGGPAFEFEPNGAFVAFRKCWGTFVENQLKRFPNNPWPDQWRNVARIAKRHGVYAVEIAKANKHRQVSEDDFVEGGHRAAKDCLEIYGREGGRGCWCNDC